MPTNGRWTLAAAVLMVAASVPAQEATYLMRGEVVPANRAANGWVQTVVATAPDEVRVHVTVDPGPIGSEAVWNGPSAASARLVPEQFRLPRDLGRSLRRGDGGWEVASTVLRWVRRHIAVDVKGMGPQDAASVLRRGTGRCSGVANAAVAFLRTAGFQARTVSGLLIGADRAVPHRWLECRLDGAGWVPSDPTLGLWVVTPHHVAFAEPVVQVPTVIPVAAAPGPASASAPLRSRVNRGAELECRAVGGAGGAVVTAELSGPGGETRRALLSPAAKFRRLAPGRWRLTVRVGVRVVERRELQLAAGRAVSYVVRVNEVG